MAGKRRKGSPEPLGKLLQASIAGTAIGERLRDLAVWQQWDRVVGPAIARRARPLRISGGKLTVVVGSAPWMQQLSFMRSELRDRLNSALGEERIAEIVLKSGRVELDAAESAKEDVVPLKPLSAQQQAWIEQQAQSLEDEGLRQQLKTLMERHYRMGNKT